MTKNDKQEDEGYNLILSILYFACLLTIHLSIYLFIVATDQLQWLISMFLLYPSCTSILTPSLYTLTFSLARLSLFSKVIYIPPILTTMGGGVVTEQILDQSLIDSDILKEYMQRSNLIGWSVRNQFEEKWMQLLGVLNSSPPHEGVSLSYIHNYKVYIHHT